MPDGSLISFVLSRQTETCFSPAPIIDRGVIDDVLLGYNCLVLSWLLADALFAARSVVLFVGCVTRFIVPCFASSPCAYAMRKFHLVFQRHDSSRFHPTLLRLVLPLLVLAGMNSQPMEAALGSRHRQGHHILPTILNDLDLVF